MTAPRFLLLNLVLVSILVTGFFRVRESWHEFELSHRVESIRPEAEPVRNPLGVPTANTATPGNWTEIAVKNPFSFDRNDVSIVAPAQSTPASPKPVLFGIMSIGKERVAFMAPGQTGNRSSKSVKVGESLDSWEVVEILEKTVVVTGANGTRATIIMNDPTAQVARAYERTASGGSAPPMNAVTPPAAAPPAAATNNPPPPTAGQQSASPAPAEDEWLITPFGKVRRTKP